VPEWLLILLCVVAFFIVRGLCMTYLLWRTDVLSERQYKFAVGEIPYQEVAQRKTEIHRLWRVAHIPQGMVLIYEPAPFGRVNQIQANLWDNVQVRDADVQQKVLTLFQQAIGYFRDEIRRSFIPIFWPSVVFNLVGDVLVYVGSPHNRPPCELPMYWSVLPRSSAQSWESSSC
jgi:hypothetical protein